MFEQAFKNIDDVLRKEAGCASELDYTEQSSWLLFLKYLDALEASRAMEWDGEAEVDSGGDKAFPPIEPKPQPDAKQPRPDYEAMKKVRVKLRDGKERTIRHISVTTFWGPDGKPISAAEFLTLLFGQLPEFFRDEDELRALWSPPDTRKKLLEGLAEKGFGKDQLGEMQKIIDAENSDLFDVLAHVSFALQPITRKERAASVHKEIHDHVGDKQQAFLDFVLAHYVQEGVGELEQEKLTKLLRLKYHDSIPDAVADLGGRHRRDPQSVYWIPEISLSATAGLSSAIMSHHAARA